MKTRRVCVMMDADEASACLVALARYIYNPPLPLDGTTYPAAARRAFKLIASRSAAIRGRRPTGDRPVKTRRVCVMMDADEASACLVALARYIDNPPLDGTTYPDAARRAFKLIASRSAAIRGRLIP